MCITVSGITQGNFVKILHVLQSSGFFCLQLSVVPLLIHTTP